MIEIVVDGQAVECAADCSVVLCASLADLTDPGTAKEKRFPLRVPMSPRNRTVLGFVEQVLSPALFNQREHHGEIRCKGTVLLRGEIELVRCEAEAAGGGEYWLSLRVPPPGWWTDAAGRPLKEIPIVYQGTLSGGEIRQSWTSDSPVRFLPVKRDRYAENGAERVTLSELGVDDYHPFVQVKALIEAMMQGSGYRIVSRFLNEPFFGSLYMSGNYAGKRIPEEGSGLSFSSVFGHDVPAIRLIEGVAHLFGLHFYTDELSKRVYIEPRFTFLEENREIDWTGKIDSGKPVAVEEPGGERSAIERYRYLDGDAAAGRAEEESGKTFGAWEAEVKNRFARTGVAEFVNPLFTATVDEKHSFFSAPDASMIVAGDRSEWVTTLNFPGKIVRYTGMKALPEGQSWGWPSFESSYPSVMFHSTAGDSLSLCFDDVDGQLGLKNYYRPLYDWMNNGKKLILYLNLTPSDIEAILHPNSAGRDFRGKFAFVLRGEKIRGRLIEAQGYDPVKGESTRCVFAVEP